MNISLNNCTKDDTAISIPKRQIRGQRMIQYPFPPSPDNSLIHPPPHPSNIPPLPRQVCLAESLFGIDREGKVPLTVYVAHEQWQWRQRPCSKEYGGNFAPFRCVLLFETSCFANISKSDQSNLILTLNLNITKLT